MNKYQNGKIYKIVNDELGLTYFGSSCNLLHKRLYEHKNRSNKEYNCTSSKILFTTEFQPQIFLVEAYPCENKLELEKRERYYIENNECVNKNIPTRSQKEYLEDNIEIWREYDRNWKKKWRLENPEKSKEIRLKSYYKNRDKILDKNKEKIECLCGSIVNKSELTRHKKTEKHLDKETKNKNEKKYNCFCGSTFNNNLKQIKRHEKTEKHLNYKIKIVH